MPQAGYQLRRMLEERRVHLSPEALDDVSKATKVPKSSISAAVMGRSVPPAALQKLMRALPQLGARR